MQALLKKNLPVTKKKDYLLWYGFLFISLSMLNSSAMAQQTDVSGVYNLKGVMEVASGFKLNPDSSFEFYFSYGALDRYGSGKWSIINNKIIFNSKPYPGQDFKLINATHTNEDFITINIQEKNTVLLSYVYAFADSLKEGEYAERADSHGAIRLNTANADSLHLLFEFTPEKISSFSLTDKSNNNFVFAFEPWIFEVFFKDFQLTLNGNNLSGKHPLIQKEQCIFEKE